MSTPKPPNLPDIRPVIEQLNPVVEQLPDVPDWLWQGLTVTAIGWSIKWAWKHRDDLLVRLRRLRPVTVVQPTGIPSEETFGSPTVSVGSERSILYDLRAKVGSERPIFYDLEAATLPLVKRLTDEGIEFLGWYLRHA